ncbi:MAG: hypothetical protein IJ189_08310 [Clostridia bacterium]|nr:hypothetical protein [Clostridia bacterium]
MEEELLVIVLAVDMQNGMTHLSIKAPAAADPNDEEKGYLSLEASGRSFSDAIALLHAATPRRLNFSQVREIIVGEQAVQDDECTGLLRQISLLPRIRGAANVIICRGSAMDFAAQVKPYLGLRLSRYTDDTLADSAGKGFTPNTTLAEGLRDLGSGLKDPLFILGAVNDFSADAPENSSSLKVSAGQLPRKSTDPIDLFGAAVTDGAAMTGALTGDEMALLHLLTGSGHFYIAQLPEMTVTLYARTPAELSVALSTRPIRLRIRLLCDVRLSPGEKPDKAALTEQITRQISALIAKLQALNSDALGFGLRAVRQFATIGAWEQLRFKALYRQAQTDVQLTLRYIDN